MTYLKVLREAIMMVETGHTHSKVYDFIQRKVKNNAEADIIMEGVFENLGLQEYIWKVER